jgi:hypothetical protein
MNAENDIPKTEGGKHVQYNRNIGQRRKKNKRTKN